MRPSRTCPEPRPVNMAALAAAKDTDRPNPRRIAAIVHRLPVHVDESTGYRSSRRERHGRCAQGAEAVVHVGGDARLAMGRAPVTLGDTRRDGVRVPTAWERARAPRRASPARRRPCGCGRADSAGGSRRVARLSGVSVSRSSVARSRLPASARLWRRARRFLRVTGRSRPAGRRG